MSANVFYIYLPRKYTYLSLCESAIQSLLVIKYLRIWSNLNAKTQHENGCTNKRSLVIV